MVSKIMAEDIKPSEENKEEVKLYTHYLLCSKCKFGFSIDVPEQNNTKIGIDKMSCPICKKPVMLDPSRFYGQGKISTEAQSKMNVEASREAMRMANELKRSDADAGIGKMIPVTSHQEGRSKGRTEMLPEKAIKSIEEKITPILEEIKE